MTICPTPRLVPVILALLASLLISGCQFAPNNNAMRWPWSKKKPPAHPDRVLAVWTDTVLHQPKQPGVRGFGGRVYFYEKDKTDPMEVDGGMAIYVFDADKLHAHDQQPLRKFVFTAEQFASHMSHTSLGPSYSVWLPWGTVGGPPMRLSLIARFEGREGGTTIGEPTIKLLPGVPKREVASEKELAAEELAAQLKGNSSPYRLAGHTTPLTDSDEEAKAEAAASRQGIKTIDLPPSFQRHLRRSSNASSTIEPLPIAPSVGTTGASAGETGSSPISPLSTLPQPTLEGLDAAELETLRAAQASAPLTTQVIDHRTRGQQRFQPHSTASTRLDIREGRWIESMPRIGRIE